MVTSWGRLFHSGMMLWSLLGEDCSTLGWYCDNFLGKTVPLWDGPRKESVLSICCPVGWNVADEVVSVPGGSGDGGGGGGGVRF